MSRQIANKEFHSQSVMRQKCLVMTNDRSLLRPLAMEQVAQTAKDFSAELISGSS